MWAYLRTGGLQMCSSINIVLNELHIFYCDSFQRQPTQVGETRKVKMDDMCIRHNSNTKFFHDFLPLPT